MRNNGDSKLFRNRSQKLLALISLVQKAGTSATDCPCIYLKSLKMSDALPTSPAKEQAVYICCA
ncbi:hypothetical protein OESDEN_02219 [Oesophagostomum dentatum]|uniref:Uncharacterized protein n=1 Tax=Oesophagostomum dentatum TaxID=61180 RepID=A0A0B1TPQ3_OESDE|nr:hypothetical protein OESDEN_02219 [Oesophagostomum dentatum]